MADEEKKQKKPVKAAQTAAKVAEDGPSWPTIGMTLQETARCLRISERAAQDLLSGGKIPGRIVAGRWRVSPEALNKFLDSYEYESAKDGE